MATTFLEQTGNFLSKDGMLPAAAAISLLASSDNYQEILNNPLSSTFGVLIGGTIAAMILEAVSPPEAKSWIAGSLLFVAGGTILARMTGIWRPQKRVSS